MVDDKKKTYDCGITAVIQVTNVSSRSDKHPTILENIYYGYLDDIIEHEFKSFKLVLFKVKWYMLQMNEHDPDRTIIEHANGFSMVNTRTFELGTKKYVLPSQCEQAFYSKVPRKVGWSYVVRYDPRGRPIKYNVPEEDDIAEEEDVEEHEVDVQLDEEVKEVELHVDDNFLDHDIDDDIFENDIDDDVDMANTFNIISKLDDTNVELDEEEYDE
jgi:hypothetical protein